MTIHPAEVVTPRGWIVNRPAEGTALTLFQGNVQRTTWTADKAARKSIIRRHLQPGSCLALDLLAVADMIHSRLKSHLELIPGSGQPLVHPAATSAAPLDAFSRLAPGEQRIARALYDAQMAGGTSDSSWSELRFLRRSLDDIARLMQGGAGWNRVFKQLKAEGVIAEQTLGHVVARWTGSGTDGCAQGARCLRKSARTRALTHPPDFPGNLPGGNTDDLVAGSGEPAPDAGRAHP